MSIKHQLPPGYEAFLEKVRHSGLFIRTLYAYAILIVLGGIGFLIWTAATAILPSVNSSNRIVTAESQAPPLSSLVRDPVEIVPTATLNPSFRDAYRPGAVNLREGIGLSAAGYPVIRVNKPMGVCADPSSVRLASDLLRAGRNTDINRMPACMLLEPGQRAEWTNPNPFNDGQLEIRLHAPGFLPRTFYGPSGNGTDDRFFAWFSTFLKG